MDIFVAILKAIMAIIATVAIDTSLAVPVMLENM
jgi:hypothetical protein